MLFTRTYKHQSSLSRDEVKKRLLGSHVQIHDLDFEVLEDRHALTIFPHAEQVIEIKTLPNTHVDLEEADGKTRLVIHSRIREMDFGGVLLMLIVCGLLFVVSIILFLAFHDFANHLAAGIVCGVGLLLFILLRVRLEKGYFDYVRKVKEYVVTQVS